MNSMKLYIFACLCSLILWGVSCDEESVGIPTGALYLGIEEDATLLTKAESAVTNESLRVDIIAAEGDTIKSYSDYIDEVKGKKIVLPVGTYTISVKSNQSEEAGWEKPFYSGSKEIRFRIRKLQSSMPAILLIISVAMKQQFPILPGACFIREMRLVPAFLKQRSLRLI